MDDAASLHADDPELLAKMMDMHEQVDEATTEQQLLALQQANQRNKHQHMSYISSLLMYIHILENAEDIQHTLGALSQAFRNHQLDAAQRETVRLKYYKTIEVLIDDKKDTVSGAPA
jgi:hemoglobin-like flavoprotein